MPLECEQVLSGFFDKMIINFALQSADSEGSCSILDKLTERYRRKKRQRKDRGAMRLLVTH